MKASFVKYQLIFKRPAGTSRGVLHTKDTYFLKIQSGEKTGYGECNLFRGLSADDLPDYEDKLNWLVNHIDLPQEAILEELYQYSSIIFGYEQAMQSLKAPKPDILYPSKFTNGEDSIPINGLVWMGDKNFMFEQIKAKIASGFKVIKLKIGAIDFKDELDLLKYIRQQFTPDDIEIRVDANGAFSPDDAFEKLKKLSEYQIHSIEQPIKQGQWEEMANLCQQTPIPIALDEELIGFDSKKMSRAAFLQLIKPQYIILKPALHGGFSGALDWIQAAKNHQIGWWLTSALESNLGLNALAQFTYQLGVDIPQGLGTGGLFTNNFDSPLFIDQGQLKYDPDKSLQFNI
jgi:O-succinylbenzoate synthase